MASTNSQDFWIVGSRLYFKKSGSGNPMTDLGVIQAVTPSITQTKVSLSDPDGGRGTLVSERVTSVEETYQIQTSNCSLSNLSLAFLGDNVDEVTRAAQFITIGHEAQPGRLIDLRLSIGGERAYMVDAIASMTRRTGSVTFNSLDLTAIDVPTRTLTFAATHGLAPGDKIIITNLAGGGGGTLLADPTHVGTYVVATAPTTTTVTVTTATAFQFGPANESGLSVLVIEYTAGVDVLVPGVDFEIYNLDRGLVRLIPADEGGMITTAAIATDFSIQMQLHAMSGFREFVPQSAEQVEGEFEIWFSRDGFTKETVRRIPRGTLSLNSSDFSSENFSTITFDISVLKSDQTTRPVGFVRQTKGDPQSLS
jgi:hypothetical protein